MSSSIGDAAASVGLTTLSVFVTLTSKGSLVDFTLWSPGEGHAVVFKFNDGSGGFTGHVVNSILISQPV